MTFQEFLKFIRTKYKEIDDYTRNRLPKIAGALAKSHFQDGFRQGGFIDSSLQKWTPARRQSDSSGGAAARYGPLLSSRQRLYKSIAFAPGAGRVRIYTPLPYAAIHNEGGTLSPSVTAKMRKFAWAKYYEALGYRKDADGNRTRKKRIPQGAEARAEVWKRLALTRKTKLQIKIPQRKFLGPSATLTKDIDAKIVEDIKKILTP